MPASLAAAGMLGFAGAVAAARAAARAAKRSFGAGGEERRARSTEHAELRLNSALLLALLHGAHGQ